jgi:DNA repair protein RadA/Sms
MEVPVSPKTVFIGELGLDGAVRPVMFMEQRVAEAERLGFSACVMPEKSGSIKTKMEIIKIKNITELKSILKI